MMKRRGRTNHHVSFVLPSNREKGRSALLSGLARQCSANCTVKKEEEHKKTSYGQSSNPYSTTQP